MKTETKIAEENIKLKNFSHRNAYCIVHKASCQRFLEVLEEEMKRWDTISKAINEYISTGELEEKIIDLKNAIKKYDEAGI